MIQLEPLHDRVVIERAEEAEETSIGDEAYVIMREREILGC